MERRPLRRLLALCCALVAAAVSVLGPSPAPARATAPAVYLVHGLPGQSLDLYVDGGLVLTGLRPGGVAGPLGLDLTRAGHEIALTPERASVGDAVVTARDLRVPTAASVSLVAHPTDDGDATISAYANDLARTGWRMARLVVRNDAAAPAAEVRIGDATAVTELAPPDQDMVDLDAGRFPVEVLVGESGEQTRLSPGTLDLAPGTSTILYLTGSSADQTLGLVVQAIDGLGTLDDPSAGRRGLGLTRGWSLLGLAGMTLFLCGVALFRKYAPGAVLTVPAGSRLARRALRAGVPGRSRPARPGPPP